MHVAAHNFGAEEADNFRWGYSQQATDAERHEWLQSNSRRYVTMSAPTRMRTRSKF